MANWDRDHIVSLISLYKRHPILYNMKHKDYYNRYKRDEALTLVYNELKKIRPKTILNEMRQKLKTLRTQFTAEKQNMKRGSGSRHFEGEPKLWCYKQLEFLESYGKVSHNSNRPEEDEEEEEDDDDEREEVILDETTVETILTEPDDITFSEDHSITIEDVMYDNNGLMSDSEASLSHKADFNQCEISTTPTKRLKRELEFETEAQNVVRYATKPHEETKEEIFGKFVTMEMKQITNITIYDETKWKIQTALMEGLRKQTKLDKS